MMPARRMMKSIAEGFMIAALLVNPHLRAGPGVAAEKLKLSPCAFAGLEAQGRCGTLSVRENPADADSRRIVIHVAVVPAKSTPLRDPIVPLLGGPGEDAISNAAFYAERLDALREHRDLLLVDQRGTGKSAPLHCNLYSPAHPGRSLTDVFPKDTAARCAEVLSHRADLTQYGYSRFVDDLERVRQALGYDSLNIIAGSYGTRAAQVYMRAHPTSVRTAFLGSVVPIDIAQPLPMAQTAQRAFEQLFQACDDDPDCHAGFPKFRFEFEDIEQRLRGSLEVNLPNHGGKTPISAGRVVEWMRSLLYRPKSAAAIPWFVHQAYLGNWDPIVAAILSQSRNVDEELSVGLFFAITCNEDIPFLDERAVAENTRGTYLGDYRVRQQQAACRSWPRSALPPGYREPVQSSIPTLFVSGDADGGTPITFMEHAAPLFSESASVVAKGQGHTEWSDCVGKLYQRLVERGSAHELVGATCAPTPRPAFETAP